MWRDGATEEGGDGERRADDVTTPNVFPHEVSGFFFFFFSSSCAAVSRRTRTWRPRFFHHTIKFLCSYYRFFPPFIEELAASSAAAAIILGLLHFNPARSWLEAPGLVMQRRVSNQWGLVGPCACLGSWSIDFWCKADEVKSREIKERQRGGRVIKVLKEKNKQIVQFHILSTHNISGLLLNLQ